MALSVLRKIAAGSAEQGLAFISSPGLTKSHNLTEVSKLKHQYGLTVVEMHLQDLPMHNVGRRC